MKIYNLYFLILKTLLFVFVNLKEQELNFNYRINDDNFFTVDISINNITKTFLIDSQEDNIILKRKMINYEDYDDSSIDEESIIGKILNDSEYNGINEYNKLEDEYNITSFANQSCNITPKFFNETNKNYNILGLKNLKYLKDNKIIEYETYSINDTYFSLGKKALLNNNSNQNIYSIGFSDNLTVKLNSIKIEQTEKKIEVKNLKLKLDSLDNFYMILDYKYLKSFLDILNKFNNNCEKIYQNIKYFIKCNNLNLNYIDINLNDEIYISIPIEKDENNIINSIIFKIFLKNPYLNILNFANKTGLELLVNTNEKKIEIIENSNITHITKISNNNDDNDENSNHKNLIIIILVSIFSLIIIIILVIILYKKCCKKEENYYYNINKTSIVVE